MDLVVETEVLRRSPVGMEKEESRKLIVQLRSELLPKRRLMMIVGSERESERECVCACVTEK